ncbi:hypothetical protein D3C78_324960 [compost metagenome]
MGAGQPQALAGLVHRDGGAGVGEEEVGVVAQAVADLAARQQGDLAVEGEVVGREDFHQHQQFGAALQRRGGRAHPQAVEAVAALDVGKAQAQAVEMAVIAAFAHVALGPGVAAGAGAGGAALGQVDGELAGAVGAQAAEPHAVAVIGEGNRAVGHVPADVGGQALGAGVGVAARAQLEPVLPGAFIDKVQVDGQAAELLVGRVTDDQAAQGGVQLEVLEGHLCIAAAHVLGQVEGQAAEAAQGAGEVLGTQDAFILVLEQAAADIQVGADTDAVAAGAPAGDAEAAAQAQVHAQPAEAAAGAGVAQVRRIRGHGRAGGVAMGEVEADAAHRADEARIPQVQLDLLAAATIDDVQVGVVQVGVERQAFDDQVEAVIAVVEGHIGEG